MHSREGGTSYDVPPKFIQKFGHENANKRKRGPPRFSHNPKKLPSEEFANYCGFTIQGPVLSNFRGTGI
jgi:hypothetical protein